MSPRPSALALLVLALLALASLASAAEPEPDCSSDPCREGKKCCFNNFGGGSRCVNLIRADDHCGDCGYECGDPEHRPLDAGRRCCGKLVGGQPQRNCVDTHTDIAHCGGCDRTCAAVANGQPVCVKGKCEVECNDGFEPSTSNTGTTTCVCPTDYEQVGAVCVPVCTDNASRDLGTGLCVCDGGFELFDDACVPVCTANAERNGAGVCACKAGFVLDGDACVCPPGLVLEGTQCVCSGGQEVVNGGCPSTCTSSFNCNFFQGCLCSDIVDQSQNVCARVPLFPTPSCQSSTTCSSSLDCPPGQVCVADARCRIGIFTTVFRNLCYPACTA